MTPGTTAQADEAKEIAPPVAAPEPHPNAQALLKPSKDNRYGIHTGLAYVIHTPDRNFNGPRCGVNFINGEARCVAMSEDATDDQIDDRNRRIRGLADAGYDVYLEGQAPKRESVKKTASGDGDFDQLNDGSVN